MRHVRTPLSAVLLAGLAAAVASSPSFASTVDSWRFLPPFAAPQPERPSGPAILGTIPIPIKAKPTSTRWSKLMLASINQPALARLTASAWGLPPEEQAAFIQAAVSHSLRTAPSRHDCSDDGYWAPASETLARGMGDCIDVAITKMEALRFLGFAGSDLFLTTGRLRTGEGPEEVRETAALLVRIGDRYWLMPERQEQIVEVGEAPLDGAPFSPVITYGVEKTWVHGRVVQLAVAHD